MNYKEGESVESLGVRYPHIPLAALDKTVAFYLHHQLAVDEFVKEYQTELDRLRAAGPVLDLTALRERHAQRLQIKS